MADPTRLQAHPHLKGNRTDKSLPSDSKKRGPMSSCSLMERRPRGPCASRPSCAGLSRGPAAGLVAHSPAPQQDSPSTARWPRRAEWKDAP